MMPHKALGLSIAALFAATAAGAQQPACTSWTSPPSRSATLPEPNDVASETAILNALYAVISGPACQHRDWDRFRSLFAPGARLIPTGVTPDGKGTIRTWTPDEYATTVGGRLENGGFFEHEVARTDETFGAITQAFSTYESRRTAADEKPFARGINSIQLWNDGTRWYVVTIYWAAERPGLTIPAKYLP